MKILRRRCAYVAVSLGLLSANSLLFAQAPSIDSSVRKENVEHGFTLQVHPEYFRFKQNSLTIVGYGVGVGFGKCLSEAWEIVPAFRQAYSRKDDFASIFSSIDLAFDYYLGGTCGDGSRKFAYDGYDFALFKRRPRAKVIAQIAAKQYFFNTSKAAVPFTGFGVSLIYEYPFDVNLRLRLGAGVDRVTNRSDMIVAAKVLGGFIILM